MIDCKIKKIETPSFLLRETRNVAGIELRHSWAYLDLKDKLLWLKITSPIAHPLPAIFTKTSRLRTGRSVQCSVKVIVGSLGLKMSQPEPIRAGVKARHHGMLCGKSSFCWPLSASVARRRVLTFICWATWHYLYPAYRSGYEISEPRC